LLPVFCRNLAVGEAGSTAGMRWTGLEMLCNNRRVAQGSAMLDAHDDLPQTSGTGGLGSGQMSPPERRPGGRV